ATCADGLDAGLLDRLEHRARLLPGGLQAAMHGRIVTGNLKRDRVGMAAYDRRLGAGELARRLRQSRLRTDQTGTLGGKGDFEVRLTRQRAQCAGDRSLERLGRRFLARRLRLAV